MLAIKAQDLTKRYGKHFAVNKVSFEIGQGEIVGFLGPNGAGKTTTLRILAGLVRPTKGKSFILGKRTPGPSLREIGTMIEEPSFYSYMTGKNNLKHSALLHGGVNLKQIDKVLHFVNMEKAAKKKVKAYSQGMRQRLGLARALLWDPNILLLDEPTNGLDPVGIAEVRESLRATAELGATILISSHILAELEKLVKRVLVIERGKLLYDGTLVNLTQRLSGKRIMYQLMATDQDKLATVLENMGQSIEKLDSGFIRTGVEKDNEDFLMRLGHYGISLLEARREADDLESAYLKLLKEDSKPQ